MTEATTTPPTPAPPATTEAAPTGEGAVRTVRATCLGCVTGECDRLEAAHAAGTLRAHGGWTSGQNLWHVGRFMSFSIDGFPFNPPLPIRMIGRLLKRGALSDRPMPTGIRLDRGGLDALIPPAETSFEEGMAELRAPLRRIEDGERFTQPSPLFGPLTHDQWVRLHAKHFAHHAAFLSYPDA